jgi:hypothetical protein
MKIRVVVMIVSFNHVTGQDLVAGGGMTPYGSGGRRNGGFVRVRDPGKGFFIGGSTLEGANGIYEQVTSIPGELAERHSLSLAYHNRLTGWYMAVSEGPFDKGYGPYGGARNEWLLIDDELNDRFGHRGETIIPGSGDRWGHLDSRWGGAMEPHEAAAAAAHAAPIVNEVEFDAEGNPIGPESAATTSTGSALATTESHADWHATRRDQLPWQVIMIGKFKSGTR